MKVTVILHPNAHPGRTDGAVAITMSDWTENWSPSMPNESQVMSAARAAARECIDRANELGFIA